MSVVRTDSTAAATAARETIVRPRPGTTTTATMAMTGSIASHARLWPSTARHARRPAAPSSRPRASAGTCRLPARITQGQKPVNHSATLAFT